MGVLERDRTEQFARLGEQASAVASGGEALREQTSALTGALRSSGTRGVWGEVRLRRVVEHAGMLAHVDFEEQASAPGPHGRTVRPDLLVRLPGGKQPGGRREGAARVLPRRRGRRRRRARCAARRPRQGVARARRRAGREGLLAGVHADSRDGGLLRAGRRRAGGGARRRPRPARARDEPAGGAGLPRHADGAAAHRRLHLAAGRAGRQRPRACSRSAASLYVRLGSLGAHATKLGRSLARGVEDYNAMIGALERRVLVSARRMHDLGLSHDPLDEPVGARRRSAPGHGVRACSMTTGWSTAPRPTTGSRLPRGAAREARSTRGAASAPPPPSRGGRLPSGRGAGSRGAWKSRLSWAEVTSSTAP
nr:DNA recombination protein RmuC [Angustibacter aerolatus]